MFTDDKILTIDQKVSEAKKYIIRKLGRGEHGVDVELDDAQLNDAVACALLWWGGIVGWYRDATIQINPAGGQFPVPDDCEEITHVYFDDYQDRIIDGYGWAGLPWAPGDYWSGYRSYGSFPSGQHSYVTQMQQYYDQARKLTSSDPMWSYSRDTRLLTIFLRPDTSAQTMGHEIKVQYQVSQPDISKLHAYEYDLVVGYAYAESMETLGNIRSKWITVPTAQGEGSLNGDSLLQAAEQLKDKLTEQARALRIPLEIVKY